MSEPQQLLAEARALAARGDYDGALARMDTLIARDPSFAAAHFNRGNLLQQAQRFEEAVRAYDAALALKSNIQVWLNRAAALRALGRNAAALASFDAALALNPENLPALIGRGVTLGLLDRPAEGLVAFDAAMGLDPNIAIAHHNRGKALYTLDRFEEARAAYSRAIELDPDYASAWNNLGVALEAIGRRGESVDAYRRAIELRQVQAAESGDPRLQNPLFNLCVAQMRAGEYAEGFRFYDLRFEAGGASRADFVDEAPSWNGGALDGVLRIWGEQGPGDQILFARLLPLVLRRTARVSIDVDARLAPLFRAAHPEIDVRAREAPVRNPAAQIALGSLPCALGLSPVDLPTQAPLLRANPMTVERLRKRYETLANGRPIVGVAWASPNAPYAAQKSTPLSDWAPLLSRGYFFVSLQYGDTRADIDAARAPIHVDDEIDQLTDMQTFAAQLAAMDHIVSVSNTLAHLAGAMGLPARITVPHGRGLHWYWGLEGASTPWYPSLRLIRRSADEAWSAVIARAARDLGEA